jgi:outer membrane biosynthesis protein TonB
MRALADDRRPALAASVALHVGVFAAGLLALSLTKPIKLGEVVPVTLVSSDQVSNMKPAVEAPTPTPAATENPAPDATPLPPAPEEAPVPTPPPMTRTPPKPAPKAETPPPKPAPTPKPTPTPKSITPSKPQPPPPPPPKPAQAKPAQPSFDPDAIFSSLEKASKAAGSRKTAAPRGPTHPETAAQARLAPGVGDQVSASAMADLGNELGRLWNPNCEVKGGSAVVVKVAFQLDSGGRVVGAPQASSENSSDPVVKAASDRAKRAVYQGQPFDTLPRALYGQRITVTFNANKFCSSQ